MRKDEHQTREPKAVYRIKNWAAYNAGLIARGDVAMWIDNSVLKQEPGAESPNRDRPYVYSDAVIQMPLGLKQVFLCHCARYRALPTAFASSLLLPATIATEIPFWEQLAAKYAISL